MQHRLSIYLLCLLAFSSLAHATSKNDSSSSVIWARTVFAPYFIIDGPFANTGSSDQIQQVISQRIPDFNHLPSTMTLKRFFAEAKSGTAQICHPALLKNSEREKFLDFSNPIQVGIGNVLVTTQKGLDLLGIDPATDKLMVTTADLLKRGFRVAYQEARSYSGPIDAAIASDTEGKIFESVAGADDTYTLLRMVSANRLDGVIARPQEASYIQQEQQLTNQLHYLEIEGTASITVEYFGCSKGAWNNALLSQINALSKTPEIRKKIDAAVMRWLPDSLKPRYLQEAAKHF